jgi:hypothetical protein
MKLTEQELNHLVFLSEVVVDARKRELMVETIRCLLYIVKSQREVDVPEDVAHTVQELVGAIEDQLRQENDRMREIRHNLTQPRDRNPFG